MKLNPFFHLRQYLFNIAREAVGVHTEELFHNVDLVDQTGKRIAELLLNKRPIVGDTIKVESLNNLFDYEFVIDSISYSETGFVTTIYGRKFGVGYIENVFKENSGITSTLLKSLAEGKYVDEIRKKINSQYGKNFTPAEMTEYILQVKKVYKAKTLMQLVALAIVNEDI